MNEYLTVKDIMNMLKIGHNAAYSMVNRKDFPKIKIGKSIRIPREEFQNYMKHNLYGDIIIK